MFSFIYRKLFGLNANGTIQVSHDHGFATPVARTSAGNRAISVGKDGFGNDLLWYLDSRGGLRQNNSLSDLPELRNAAVEQAPGAPVPDPSALRTPSSAGLRLLGAVLLLLSILMMSTFVLLPAGVPLALLAAALIAAPGEF